MNNWSSISQGYSFRYSIPYQCATTTDKTYYKYITVWPLDTAPVCGLCSQRFTCDSCTRMQYSRPEGSWVCTGENCLPFILQSVCTRFLHPIRTVFTLVLVQDVLSVRKTMHTQHYKYSATIPPIEGLWKQHLASRLHSPLCWIQNQVWYFMEANCLLAHWSLPWCPVKGSNVNLQILSW